MATSASLARRSVLSHHTQLSQGISNQNLRTKYMVSFLPSPLLKSSIAVCSSDLSLKSNESIFFSLRVWEQILPKGGGWMEERFRYISAFLSCQVALLTVGCTEVTRHPGTKWAAQNWKDGFITRDLGRVAGSLGSAETVTGSWTHQPASLFIDSQGVPGYSKWSGHSLRDSS